MIMGRREGNIIKAMYLKAMCPTYSVRSAYREEWDDAMALAWRTFMRFEANDYTQEGIESFQNFITDTVLHRMFLIGSYQLFVACENNQVIGMISLRSQTHISLLFVDAAHHRMGIGRALIEYVCNYIRTEEGYNKVTVNAAPYAVGFYHKLGFRDTQAEQTSEGIRYTPMERRL